MREIKFRAWVKNEYDGDDLVEYMEEDASCFVNPFEDHEDGEIILMQYTGLKDKYGMDIYEGDIIDCEIYGQKHRGVVQYADMLAVYYLTGLSRSDTELWLASKKQIIGNKYEHPHLLESEDDL